MINRDDLIVSVNQILGTDLLLKAAQIDEMANGVQILGGEKVTKVALGVSCNQEFLDAAIEWGAEVCIFHHGLDTRSEKFRFPVYTQNRLRTIFQNNLTIVGYHYTIDAHSVIGNNAQIIKLLGADITDTLFQEWGFTADFKKPVSVGELEKRCKNLFGQLNIFKAKDTHIKTIGVVSGAGKPYQTDIEEMVAKGVQVYISGEGSESTPHKLIESGISYFLGGHHNTETFGVKALSDVINDYYDGQIEAKFIDIPNIL